MSFCVCYVCFVNTMSIETDDALVLRFFFFSFLFLVNVLSFWVLLLDVEFKFLFFFFLFLKYPSKVFYPRILLIFFLILYIYIWMVNIKE